MALAIELRFSPKELYFSLTQNDQGVFTEVKKSQIYREANDLEKKKFTREFGADGALFFNSIEEAVDDRGKTVMVEIPLIAFSDPREFTVPKTGGKSQIELDKLIAADVRYLKLRTGNVNFDLYTPNQTSTFERLSKLGFNPFRPGKEELRCFVLKNGSVVSLVGDEYKVDGRKPDERGEGNTFIARFGVIRSSTVLPRL